MSLYVFARLSIHLWCSGNNKLLQNYFAEQQETLQYILQKCMLVSVLYLAKESQMIMQTASTDPLWGNDQNLWCKNDITFVTVQKTAFGVRANVFG